MFYKMLFTVLFLVTFSHGATDIRTLETFQGNFTQSIKSTTDKTIEYKGKVFIKNNGKILWKYKTPIEKNVYIINDYAIIDEPELEQAIYTQLQNEINIIKLLKDSQKINEYTYMAKIDGVNYLIETSKTDKKIETIKYKDKLDNSVTISFSNSLENETIDDKTFTFKAPDDYDIIRK